MASQEMRNLVSLPTINDLKEINEKYKLGCNGDELQEYQNIIKNTVSDYNFIDEVEVPNYVSQYGGKREYNRPEASENQYNAWYVKCNIAGATNGKLAGKRIAIKDNTAVAEIPMMSGSKVIEGYIPEYDATIVQRILDAGGIITGKTTCEDLCASGGSFLTTYGPVRNPHNVDHSAGGSSSGSGVVVAIGEADMAIGGDQGGSIRMPSSDCGIVGLKPTHGLVPYTGAMPIVPCVDHLGPMARNVADCALLLEVIAGYDHGFDYRQRPFEIHEYSKLIFPHVQPTRKLKIAILQEGVDLCDQNVQDVFTNSLQWLKDCIHLEAEKISLPRHAISLKLALPISGNGIFGSMIDGCGNGTGVSGMQSHTLVKKMFDGYKEHGNEMSEVLKMFTFFGSYLQKHYGPYHFAKASTLVAHLSQEYNTFLEKFDVLIMPTLKTTPCRIPGKEATTTEKITKALNKSANTAIFDVTGHPALTLNCGFDNDLPVGLMIVGKHYDEVGVLNVASIFESVFQEHLPKQLLTQK